jgi:hypothetical protein
MTSSNRSNLTVETLLALRSEPYAVQLITEQLRVKDMGPADHIRTKHEVKSFVETGDRVAAEALLERSQQRHAQTQSLLQKAKVTQTQRL